MDKLKGAVRLIIVDDSSTDQSLDYLHDIEASRSFTSVQVTPERLGPGGARNLCIQFSNTPIVAFADDDDLVDVGTLLHVASLAFVSGVDAVASTYRVGPRPASSWHKSARTVVPNAQDRMVDLLRPFPAVWRFVFSRNFLTARNLRFPQLDYAEDLLFLLEVATWEPKLLVVNDIYYQHFLSPRSLSGSVSRLGSQPLQAQRKLGQIATSNRVSGDIKCAANEWAARIAGRTLVYGSVPQRMDMARYCLHQPRVLAYLLRFAPSATSLTTLVRSLK